MRKLSQANAMDLLSMESALIASRAYFSRLGRNGVSDFVTDVLNDIRQINILLDDIRYRIDLLRPHWLEQEGKE